MQHSVEIMRLRHGHPLYTVGHNSFTREAEVPTMTHRLKCSKSYEPAYQAPPVVTVVAIDPPYSSCCHPCQGLLLPGSSYGSLHPCHPLCKGSLGLCPQ
jgi:hypothetical protein